MFAHLQQDLRHVLRGLGRSPLFAVLAVLILGLGIGASTAVYTAVDAVLLRALPYPGGERLVALWVDARARDMPRQEWTNPADVAFQLGALVKAVLLDMDFAISIYLEASEEAKKKARREGISAAGEATMPEFRGSREVPSQ